jgi:hypothetical protein
VSSAGGQLQSQHEIYNKQYNKQNKEDIKVKRRMIKLGFLTFKCRLLKISRNLQTEFAARTHLAVGQWLEEQLNVEKFRMFRVGTRKPSASRTGGQN